MYQNNKIILSAFRHNKSDFTNRMNTRLLRNELELLFSKGLLKAVTPVTGVYTDRASGVRSTEMSFVVELDSRSEVEAYNAVKALAFGQFKQESVLFVNYKREAVLVYYNNKKEKLGKFELTNNANAENYTKTLGGQIYEVV